MEPVANKKCIISIEVVFAVNCWQSVVIVCELLAVSDGFFFENVGQSGVFL